MPERIQFADGTVQSTAATSAITSVLDAYGGYGVRADGTDNSTRLQNALNAARDAGPGATLALPPGTILLASPVFFDTNVCITGSGEGATILKQANNSNMTGMLKSRSYDSLVGTTSRAGETRFEISRILFDGNKTNNTLVATDGVQIFGYRYYMHDVAARGWLGNGFNAEWGTAGSPSVAEPYAVGGQTGPMECFWDNVRSYFNAKSGIVFNGPNDAVLSRLFACMNAFAGDNPALAVVPNIWLKSKALETKLTDSHVWNGGQYGFQFDSTAECVDCTAEGALDAMVYVNVASVKWVGGFVFSAAGTPFSNDVGFKFGASGSIVLTDTTMSELSGGFFDFSTGGGGGSDLNAFCFASTAQALTVGAPSQNVSWNLRGAIGGDQPNNFLPTGARRILRSDQRTDFGSVGMEDEFVHGNVTSGQIGSLGWTTYFSGTAAIATQAPSFNHPGVVRLTTGATSGSVAALGLCGTTTGALVLNNESDHVFVVDPQVDANTTLRVGLCADPAANPSADGVWIEKLAGDTNWFGVCRNTGTQTRVDTGVAAANFTWTRLRIRWYFTAALRFQFIVGQQTGAAVPVEITTNIPALSTALQPFIQILNTTAASKLMDVDYYGGRIVNLNR